MLNRFRLSHPYSQLFRRVDDNTRMDNQNWQEKFPEEAYLELFRFRKQDMMLLATALEASRPLF
jgi:hypothetical protein